MLHLWPLVPLAGLTLCALSCAALAQARPPALVLTGPVAVSSDVTQDGPVKLEVGVWRRTYEVPGAKIGEIERNLDALRLSAGDGDYSAETKWDLRWSLHYDQNHGDGCGIASALIDYDAVITLPELADESALTPAQLEAWRTYAGALEQHELGHVQREVAVAEDLLHALPAVGKQSDCPALAALVGRLGENHKQAARQADDAFDAETGHGALTGATFP